MQKVLVTGANGFIGKHLIELLLKKNYSVRALIRNVDNKHNRSESVEYIVGDLTQQTSLTGICTDIETVFHLGGYAHAWEESSSTFADQHHAVNFVGTQHLLQESIRAGVKQFVFFSSVKAVADCQDCIDETWDTHPTSPYGIAKRNAEKIVLAAKETGMHTCVIRPTLVYGPQWKGNLANMLHAIDRGLFPPLPNVSNKRSMISQHDICRAAILAANHPSANGKIYFVTDGMSYSTRQLYLLMSEALGKRIPNWHIPMWFFKLMATVGDLGKRLLKKRLPFDSAAMTKLFGSAEYDASRIQRELGFTPTQTLQTALPEIIAAYGHR